MANKPKTVLILGASGMLGNTLFRHLTRCPNISVFGTIRSNIGIENFYNAYAKNIVCNVHILKLSEVDLLFSKLKPDVVINCIGLIKQSTNSENFIDSITINSLLPHQLAKLCSMHNSRFIHISTDCVFSGAKGLYTEKDLPDANDLYGRTKYLGEVNYPNTVTLRTSIIGHELVTKKSLIEWFLSKEEGIQGYTNAIFSGLPSNELSKVISNYVIPNDKLQGLYHISSDPINKSELLEIINHVYKKNLVITPTDTPKINRSLDSTHFKTITGYKPSNWKDLVISMEKFR